MRKTGKRIGAALVLSLALCPVTGAAYADRTVTLTKEQQRLLSMLLGDTPIQDS